MGDTILFYPAFQAISAKAALLIANYVGTRAQFRDASLVSNSENQWADSSTIEI